MTTFDVAYGIARALHKASHVTSVSFGEWAEERHYSKDRVELSYAFELFCSEDVVEAELAAA